MAVTSRALAAVAGLPATAAAPAPGTRVLPRCVSCGRLYVGAMRPLRTPEWLRQPGVTLLAPVTASVSDGWGYRSAVAHDEPVTSWSGPYCPRCLTRGDAGIYAYPGVRAHP